ncbi:TIGR03118 family protein [Bdellovibrio sp. qaytius]|nr:TIGR03118 family protein [Bdellovibrio sp. qaytius]
MFQSKAIILLTSALIISGCSTPKVKPTAVNSENNFGQINLVANRAEFKPQIVDPQMQNAWGLANRPAGLGGHFWITAQKAGSSIEYVGDVGQQKLFQDGLKNVDLSHKKGKLDSPTGVVFNPSTNFVIEQPSKSGKFTSESKFIFASDSGRIYGWAEKKNADGTFNRPTDGVVKVNNQKRGDQYFGLGIDSKGEKLIVADFGTKPQIRMFDSKFKEIKLAKDQFKNPFIKGAYTKAGEYGPYNVQVLNLGSTEHVFVAYSEIEKHPKTGKLEAGEEQKGEGLGRVVEYDLDGKLVRVWNDKGLLNAPWGFAVAPSEGFGKFSGALLVGNFGDGTIVAFDPKTFEAIDYLKSKGNKIQIEGLWGIMFGNGASLGEKNHLYFAAGPNDETDGIFGKIKSETSQE